MARKTLPHKARYCTNDWFQSLRDLVLDDGMKRSMRFEVWDWLTRGAVIPLSKPHAALLIKRKPLGRNRLHIGVITLHGSYL
jgi:hypothetical protein